MVGITPKTTYKEGTGNIKLAIESVIPQRVLDERAQYNTTRSCKYSFGSGVHLTSSGEHIFLRKS